MIHYKVLNVEFLNNDIPDEREIKCTLDNGTVITIQSCCESWEQLGGTIEEKYATVPIAERFNGWLHGGPM